ncbi:recombinase family protein [Methylobacterium sp. R2-1]|uniref:recombinase family protein n=1 Tax=Methylobacterium sp. R2-1 TaxID=2587064 RepID=UPI00181CFE8A|nr:resolvase [Methylobacterium sp. R2-1]MBB2961549.1 hypothetical protein [Methylobacterium sp. R2-1]
MSSNEFISYLYAGPSASGRSSAQLASQRAAVDQHVRGRGRLVAEIAAVEQERQGVAGARLQDALARCRRCGATLLMADFRAVSDDCVFLRDLSNALRRLDLRFAAVDSPQVSELMLGIMAALAEAEDRSGVTCTPETMARRGEFYARFTAEGRARTAAGRTSLPAFGYERPHLPAESRLRGTSAQRSQERAEGVAPILSEIRAAGALTLEQVANALNALGVPSARGNRWYPMQVTRVETRLATEYAAVGQKSRSFAHPLHA